METIQLDDWKISLESNGKKDLRNTYQFYDLNFNNRLINLIIHLTLTISEQYHLSLTAKKITDKLANPMTQTLIMDWET